MLKEYLDKIISRVYEIVKHKKTKNPEKVVQKKSARSMPEAKKIKHPLPPKPPKIKMRMFFYLIFGFLFLVLWASNLENVWSLFISGLFYGIALHVAMSSIEELHNSREH